MRRFDTPAAPLGWAGQGAELLRIVDPTGRAIAWLAPGFGANCVGYAVRQGDAETGTWRHILHFNHHNDGVIGGGRLADEFVLLPIIFAKRYRPPRVPRWGSPTRPSCARAIAASPT